MRIIKLNAIDSTNSYLRRLSFNETIEDFTVVVAEHQTQGKGQMGTQWLSQEGKNLTVSIFKDISFLKTEHNFYISMVVSLAVLTALKAFHVQKLKVKWPNDILSDTKKVAGILIENVIKHNQLQASIIGLGLNVNQTEFDGLPSASSLRLILGRPFDIDEVLQEILRQFQIYFQRLEAGHLGQIKRDYEQLLFRNGKPSTFRDLQGELFSGFITGISETGKLQVQTEQAKVEEFDLKEISLLY